MAEAARIEQMQVPNGGIADFVMSDEDIETVYGPDEEDGAEEYGTEGLGQFTEIANQMAEKGRYGDDTVAHLESGELVIPKAFLDQDPEMAKTLFAYLERMGVENPQRYVVGSDANSINPETGLPEFFFKKFVRTVTKPIKKTVKKVTKAVSKAVKPVIKIVQKVAPIVLPLALAATPLGPVFGAALGSGIASLINGESLKDSFKKALISGAIGAVGVGVSGMMTPNGSFFGSIGDAISDPVGRFGQTIAGAENSLTRLVGGAVAPEAPGFFSNYVQPIDSILKPSTATQQALQSTNQPVSTESVRLEATAGTNVPAPSAATASTPSGEMAAFAEPYTTTGSLSDFTPQQLSSATKVGQSLTDPSLMIQDLGTVKSVPTAMEAAPSAASLNAPDADLMIQDLSTVDAQPSFLDTAQNYAQKAYDTVKGASSLTPAEMSKINADSAAAYIQDFNAANNTSYTFANAPASVQNAALEYGKSAVAAAQPGLLAKYGPMALAGAGTLALTEATGLTNLTDQFFTPPPQEEVGLVERDEQGNVITGQDLIEQDPERYLVSDLGQQVYNPATGEYELVQNLDPRSTSYTNFLSPSSFKYDLFSPQSTPGGPFQRPVMSADGGPIFPRRNGGIMPNEGVPGKDSVRAMLMPGEFVMTTDAVRGAGDGNLNRGIKNMYSVMRDLESRGRRMA